MVHVLTLAFADLLQSLAFRRQCPPASDLVVSDVPTVHVLWSGERTVRCLLAILLLHPYSHLIAFKEFPLCL